MAMIYCCFYVRYDNKIQMVSLHSKQMLDRGTKCLYYFYFIFSKSKTTFYVLKTTNRTVLFIAKVKEKDS